MRCFPPNPSHYSWRAHKLQLRFSGWEEYTGKSSRRYPYRGILFPVTCSVVSPEFPSSLSPRNRVISVDRRVVSRPARFIRLRFIRSILKQYYERFHPPRRVSYDFCTLWNQFTGRLILQFIACRARLSNFRYLRLELYTVFYRVNTYTRRFGYWYVGTYARIYNIICILCRHFMACHINGPIISTDGVIVYLYIYYIDRIQMKID